MLKILYLIIKPIQDKGLGKPVDVVKNLFSTLNETLPNVQGSGSFLQVALFQPKFEVRIV